MICKLVSGGDEKVIRKFEAPFNIVKFLKELSKVDLVFSQEHDNSYYEKHLTNKSGKKQALGLLNKAAKIENNQEDGEEGDYGQFNPENYLTQKVHETLDNVNFNVPPDEDFLTNNTLFLETHKFYGNGYDLFSIACSKDGNINNLLNILIYYFI